MAAARKMTVIC